MTLLDGKDAMNGERRQSIRVAFFSDAPWVGGAERYLHLLAANLPARGFAPFLIVNDAVRLDALGSWMRDSGIPVHEVPLALPFRLGGIRTFVRTLRSLNITLLHCNMPGPWGSQYGLIAPLAKLAGVRAVVATEHLPMIQPFAKGAILKRIGGAFIDRVITVSDNNVRWLEEYHHVPRRKIRVVHIGVPDPPATDGVAARSALGFSRDDFIYLIAASLEERKGHPFAFEALARLSPRAKLIVAGSGDAAEAYRRRCRELGIEERVRFLGFRGDIVSLLAASDVLLVPSLLEATPYVIAEAMAFGRAVIASRIYGIPELVIDGETGLLTEAGDVNDLARAMADLERNRALVERFGVSGRSRFESAFRIERCIEETIAVYREITARA